MDEYESRSHTKWECKYHVVFIPKCRRKVLYGQLRPHLGEVFRKLAEQKGSRIEEGHLMPDHVHMMIAIPPKHERDPSGAGVRRKEAEFRWPAFLGERVFRFHGRAGRSRDPGIHPQPGEGRSALGANESVALTGHRIGGS